MRLKLKYELCEPAKLINEDTTYYGENFGVILDGSTGLRKKSIGTNENGAKWFVEEFKEVLIKHINQELLLPEIIKQCIRVMNDKLKELGEMDSDKVDLPSASMVVIKQTGEELETFSLGDCTLILVDENQNIEHIYDNSVSKLDDEVIEYMVQISEMDNIPVSEARNKVQGYLIKNRYKKNTKDGYWILGLEEHAVDHGHYKKYDLQKISRIYMFSDGLAESYEHMILARNYKEFIERLDKQGINEIYMALREKQNEDKECNVYPRLKVKDDVSIQVFDIE